MRDQRGPGLLDTTFGQLPFAAGVAETGTEAIPVPGQPSLPGELPGQPGMPELVQLVFGIPEAAPQRRDAVHYAVVLLVKGAGPGPHARPCSSSRRQRRPVSRVCTPAYQSAEFSASCAAWR